MAPSGAAAPVHVEQMLTAETDDGMSVTIAGYMPAEAELWVETVPQEVAAGFIDADDAIVFAYDLKLMLPDPDAGGWTEYQPAAALTVAVAPCTAAESLAESPVEVTHVSMDEATQQACVTKVPAAVQEGGAVTFAAESFSYYIGTVSTPLREVTLTAGEGYAFYSDAACTEPISGEQQISAAAAIYLKAAESYQIRTVTVVGADGSPGIGLIEPGDGETSAYDEKITFPAETEPLQPAQLITVQVMQTLWYNGDGFYSDAECLRPAVGPSDLAERVEHAACTLWINMLTSYTPDGIVSLDGQDNVVLLMRDASYPGALLTIPSGAQLTLSHITLDGGAIWSGEPDTTLERGTDNSGLKAQAPLITVEGSLIMSTGAALQNNDNASSPGGAIYVSANGTMTMYDGVIGSNTASSKDNGYGGAIYSQAKGTESQSGLVIAGGYISGNQAACASTICRGGSIQLDDAALTIYDMCKAVDRGMEIVDVRLLHKEGGRSGVWDRAERQAAAVEAAAADGNAPTSAPVAVAPAAPAPAVPAIAFIGYQNSGKTTLVEKVIAELTRRGLRVGSLKHHGHHGFDIDVPAKDTWRHHQAGSKHVGLICATRWAEYADTREENEMPARELLSRYNDVDVVIIEGYKTEGFDNIVVARSGVDRLRGKSSLDLVDGRTLALACNEALARQAFDAGFATRAININDARAICDLIQDHLA